MKHKSEFLNFIQERGYLYQCTNIDRLDQLLSQDNYIIAYIGFDCTAPSLHIGSLIQIMMLRHLQKFGYKPIVLLGGGTTKIGDPSGKDKARSVLPIEDINQNILGIKKTLEKMISFDYGKTGAIIVNNADWLDNIKYIDFLRDIGTHFSVNRMLGFDSVKIRLDREQNLSFLEFNYMLLQAYDFVELNKKYGCCLQIGGSDQWGNIVNGIELGKKLNLPELFGLTTPLLLNAQGKKMGKTESGAVWLDGSMLNSYDYWQYFRDVDDQDVGHFLRLFTDLPIDEIKKLESLKDQEINEAKKVLATEVTRICHGDKEAEIARLTAISAFENQDSSLLSGYTITREQVTNGILLIDLLHDTGFEPSKGAAKRLIQGNGCKVNDNTINDINYIINSESFKGQPFIKLSAGKKRHIRVMVGEVRK
ncbi:Tyrosyl-tRNA synthetase [Wolbachia endosymbiont of Drosophila simulans wNo]|uniref:tyrosine--tRNA ligase n=1 Tax=unclassified Wolbachia TaxID=2640676 RepID=UPI0002D2536C|nr:MULTISPECIES: tyrosine--tRNA ligase [unclassified Wolbachia]AGJ99075.1 Tyrosyl-tRNA synthetase [Wolbachia endosymbiont of Drosophila simulans wNo]QCB62426.1 tyrosine--tRNA ligase [Wolbachia endosymbiont of Drosophila mauritiana]QCB63473.1 tyrosine--tRNA ligase [Wolbachia endosymbiont of Drosophila mauritiana]QWE33259.1 Tyrosine--tRNA ligase [Wolbachia endosymbiont of Drosophila simulans]TGB07375.1 tyrosine--tRNA ligase [Wolbachia endosymbiont of Drosophila mauritiana]